MNDVRIGVYGPTGRMGQSIIKQSSNFKNLKIVSLFEKKGHQMVGKKINGLVVHTNLGSLIEDSDIIIDFTTPMATIELLKMIKKTKKTALVTGTTGFSKILEKKFIHLTKGLVVLRSFNMSFGVNILKSLVKFASENLSSIADIEISEIHHRLKRDTPSGTAISLAESIKDGSKISKGYYYRKESKSEIRKKHNIAFTSIRGGDVIGEHTVFFFMDGERIELTHKANDRKIFSNGALKAAKWLYGKKPDLYSLLDMVK